MGGRGSVTVFEWKHLASFSWDCLCVQCMSPVIYGILYFFFLMRWLYIHYILLIHKNAHTVYNQCWHWHSSTVFHTSPFFFHRCRGGGELLRHILRSFLITSCSKCFEKSFGSRREFYDKRVFTLSHSLWPLHFFLFLFFAVSRFWTQRDILLLKHFSHLRKSIHSENIYTFACQGLSVLWLSEPVFNKHPHDLF